jgi:quaternary ammonium compound-resistance protein SugE
MAWFWLFLAGLFEIGWAIGLKYTDGFSKLIPSLLTIAMMIVSFFLLSIAVKEIPIGTGYAVWTGIGAIGVAIAGIILFQESRDILRLICIGLIIIGVLGLKWVQG